ncbi:hybrid sensor histidine kinase/response regulator transcription factor [Mucilaginibacter sp. HD30]
MRQDNSHKHVPLQVSRFCITLLCCVFIALTSRAQEKIKFTSLTTIQGLSSNTVNDLLKDNDGFLWIATNDGLDKFDGTNITVYRNEPGNASSLPNNEVTVLFKDRRGRIWIGTSNGICYYDTNLDKFIKCKSQGKVPGVDDMAVRAIYQDSADLLWFGGYANLVTLDPQTMKFDALPIQLKKQNTSALTVYLSFFEDESKQIWIGTNKGLVIYNKRTKRYVHFIHDASDKNSISNNIIKKIIRDNEGHIWIATFEGLNKMNPDRKSFQLFPKDKGFSSLDQQIHAVLKTAGNTFWLGTENGLNIFDLKTTTITGIKSDRGNPFGLSNQTVKSLFSDADGIIWLGTAQGGLFKYDPHLTLFNLQQYNESNPNSLTGPVVTSFGQDATGKIYVGTDGGVQLFDPEKRIFKPGKIKNVKALNVRSILVSKEGVLWLGTIHQGLLKVNPESGEYQRYLLHTADKNIGDNDIYCFAQDKSGRIWVGTNGDGVYVYDSIKDDFVRFYEPNQSKEKTDRPVNGYMRALAEKVNGDMWMGTIGAGIEIYHPKKNLRRLNNANSGLSTDAVLSIFHDNTGHTWVGTQGGGLNLFNEKTGRFKSFTEKDGLASNIVGSILQDSSGKIWMSTAKGITCFDPAKEVFKNFDSHNGVQPGSMMVGAGLRSRDGSLYFGGYEGFNYFKPSLLPNDNYRHNVKFTDLKVANSTITPGAESPIQANINTARKIDLSYGQNFSISFVAINFTNPERTRYSYQLTGFDNDWNFTGKSRTAYYTNIDPGSYLFKVRASDDKSGWNGNMATIEVVIHPPFWRTTYAYVIYVIAAAALLLFIRSRGIKRIEEKYHLEQERLKNKQLIDEERREAERLHELDELKIKFLINLTHELRTPVALIMATLDNLFVAPAKSEASQIKVIRRNARRLLNFVNQLLDFRKIEEHNLKLNLTEGDLMLFVRESADSFRDIAEQKGIRLEIENDPESIIARFDQDKIERIIYNMLSNALKFTHKGGLIKVACSVFFKENAPHLILVVSDTGTGINADDKSKIFERFFQSGGDSAVLNQGSGIGLSITKEYVEFIGGHITVDSDSRGTTFTVVLPIIEYQLASAIPQATGDETDADDAVFETSAFLTTPILIVEDDDDFRAYLKDSLKDYYQVIEAADGLEGWKKVLSLHPQLVVADVNMPNMSGVELSQKIKMDKRTNQLPVILLTALGGEQAQIRGLRSGANDYLTKPFNFQILNEKIRNLLMLSQVSKETYSRHLSYEGPDIVIESEGEKLLKQILAFIEDNMVDPNLSVDQLSKHIGMSRTTLYHKIITLTGKTPIEYIRKIKLERAALLLKKSGKNVAQVSFLTGFASPSYFSRKFKEEFKMLPSEFVNATSEKG